MVQEGLIIFEDWDCYLMVWHDSMLCFSLLFIEKTAVIAFGAKAHVYLSLYFDPKAE